MKSLKDWGLVPIEKETLVATIGGGYPNNPGLNPIGPPIVCCYNNAKKMSTLPQYHRS